MNQYTNKYRAALYNKCKTTNNIMKGKKHFNRTNEMKVKSFQIQNYIRK